ncbi:MAG TPA: MATE family efflux transporter, partial [Anaerovoracaceae bacterium]|nr:MATE family efflux transporter [Anaerovoracaceae bacterium]
MSKYINPLDNSISQRRIVLIMAWPVIVEQILQTLVNYIDTAMVGSLGVEATASVSINTTLIWLINGIIMGLSTGFSVPIAQAVGEGNQEKAKAIIRQAVIGMLAFGACATLIIECICVPFHAHIMGAEEAIVAPAQHYLAIIGISIVFEVFLAVSSAIVRGMGNTKTPMFYNILLNCINVAMNFLFIYPTRMMDIFGHSVKIYGFGMG